MFTLLWFLRAAVFNPAERVGANARLLGVCSGCVFMPYRT
jgi:hypothetical protein